MSETKYFVWGIFFFTAIIVGIPLAVTSVGDGIPDVEPTGLFAVLTTIINSIVNALFSIAKIFIFSNTFDALLDEWNESVQQFFINQAKIFSLVPFSLWAIIAIPLIAGIFYASIKALPTT